MIPQLPRFRPGQPSISARLMNNAVAMLRALANVVGHGVTATLDASGEALGVPARKRVPMYRQRGQSLRIARLTDFYYDDSNVAVAFWGFFIAAIAAPNPDPLPGPEDLTVFWPLRWPWIVAPTNDMRYVLPGVPFESEDGYSDVLVAEFPYGSSSSKRWYIVTPHFVGVCI